jgi:aspartate 1-decarboxylase
MEPDHTAPLTRLTWPSVPQTSKASRRFPLPLRIPTMHRTLLAAKIHSCTVTDANLQYMGSISIDEFLLAATGIVPYEQVHVVNVNNGERFITYAIAATPGSGSIELNGAAARLGVKGDKLIVMTYAQFSDIEAKNHQPRVAMVDDLNQITEVKSDIPTGWG